MRALMFQNKEWPISVSVVSCYTSTPPIVSALLQGEKVCEMKIAGRSTDGSASCEDLTV